MFSTIIADPPWSYDNTGTRGAAANQYSTMTIGDICDLPIADIANKDAVLLLWGTWPLLPEALQVMQAWGFKYVTGFPWVKIHGVPQTTLWGELIIKPRYGVGHWVRGCSEYVFVGRRGKVELPDKDFMGLISENYRHSRKPENLYDFAESLQGPYLEIFARRRRVGWTCIGNEITKRDIREDLSLLLTEEVAA